MRITATERGACLFAYNAVNDPSSCLHKNAFRSLSDIAVLSIQRNGTVLGKYFCVTGRLPSVRTVPASRSSSLCHDQSYIYYIYVYIVDIHVQQTVALWPTWLSWLVSLEHFSHKTAKIDKNRTPNSTQMWPTVSNAALNAYRFVWMDRASAWRESWRQGFAPSHGWQSYRSYGCYRYNNSTKCN